MSILLQKKNVGDYSYMSSPNIYYRACYLVSKGATKAATPNCVPLEMVSFLGIFSYY